MQTMKDALVRAERDFDEIIRVHMEDDLGGRFPS